jgi:hypothetical protein
VLLPLYPQYSTTTTASSLKAWREAYKGSGRSDRLLLSRGRRAGSRPMPSVIREALAAGRPARRRACCSRPMACRRRSSMAATPTRARSNHGRGGGARLGGLGLEGLLPEPGRADEVAGPLDARGDRRGGADARSRAWSSARSPSSPNTSRPWSSSTTNTPRLADQMGCVPICAPAPGVAAGFIAGLRRRRWRWSACAEAGHRRGAWPARPCDPAGCVRAEAGSA